MLDASDPISKASVERSVDVAQTPSETIITINLQIVLKVSSESWVSDLLKNNVDPEMVIEAISAMYNVNKV